MLISTSASIPIPAIQVTMTKIEAYTIVTTLKQVMLLVQQTDTTNAAYIRRAYCVALGTTEQFLDELQAAIDTMTAGAK